MERINIPASLYNLEKMNKIQTRDNDVPLNYQQYNSQTAEQETAQKMQKPNELDQAENRLVDPDERRKEREKRKKRKPSHKTDEPPENRGPASGKFVDFSA